MGKTLRTIGAILGAGSIAALLAVFFEPFLFGVLARVGIDTSKWVEPVMDSAWLIPGLFLIAGLGAGIWLHWLANRADLNATAPRAVLRLKFHGNTSTPDETYSENISSWFSFYTKSLSVSNEQTGKLVELHPDWFLSIRFRRPVEYRQVKVIISGDKIKHQCHQQLSDGVLVYLDGPVSECEVEIRTG